MDLQNIEKEVIKWHRATFPHATMDAMFNKFSEEMFEFEDDVLSEMPDIFTGTPAVEFADMCIVFMAARAKLNLPPLSELIADKLIINRGRIWGEENSSGDRPREK